MKGLTPYIYCYMYVVKARLHRLAGKVTSEWDNRLYVVHQNLQAFSRWSFGVWRHPLGRGALVTALRFRGAMPSSTASGFDIELAVCRLREEYFARHSSFSLILRRRQSFRHPQVIRIISSRTTSSQPITQSQTVVANFPGFSPDPIARKIINIQRKAIYFSVYFRVFFCCAHNESRAIKRKWFMQEKTQWHKSFS